MKIMRRITKRRLLFQLFCGWPKVFRLVKTSNINFQPPIHNIFGSTGNYGVGILSSIPVIANEDKEEKGDGILSLLSIFKEGNGEYNGTISKVLV